MQECLRGPLSYGRTIILVTHQVHLCSPAAGFIVELTGGKVTRSGTRDQFQSSGGSAYVIKNGFETSKIDNKFLVPTLKREVDKGDIDNVIRQDSDEIEPVHAKLLDVENRSKGRVTYRTYMTYILAGGSYCWILTILFILLMRFMNVASQVLSSRTYLWLSH